jgi:hypothetical protein
MSDVRDDYRTLIGARAENEVRRTLKEVTFAAPARATLATALTGNNNDLDYSAVNYGEAGNNTTIAYVNPGLPSQSIAVVVTGSAIVVNLATDSGTNEVQTLTVVASAGTFTLTFKDQSTATLAYNISAASLQTALEQVASIGTGNVAVSGSAGGPFTITFQGALAATNVPLLTVDANGLRPLKPRIQVVTATAGSASPATNEVQKIQLQNASVGTFTVTFNGQTTSALAYGVSAAAMQVALRALSSINGANCTVTKVGDEYTVTFIGTLAAANQPQMTANATGLKASATVVETTTGVVPAITSTATTVKTALAASNAADALITATNHSGNDGSGVVTAMSATHLSGGTQGYGTRAATATATTSLTGNNNDLVFTAVPTGNTGNGITVTYVDPGGTTATLGVVVDIQERAITVNLGRAASAINSTAGAIATAIAANTDAAALVTVANASANDGTGLVTAMSALTLTGGASNVSLFNVSGEVMAAVTVTPITSMTGASAVFRIGSVAVDNVFMSAITATGVTKGVVVDKTGVVASGTAPVIAPFAPLVDGDVVSLKPATADITGGHVMIACYWTPLSDGARVLPV